MDHQNFLFVFREWIFQVYPCISLAWLFTWWLLCQTKQYVNNGPGHSVCLYVHNNVPTLTKFGIQGTACGEINFMLCWMLHLTSWINTCVYKIHIQKSWLYQKVLNFIAAMGIIECSNQILLKNMEDLEFTWPQDNTY